MKLLNLLLLKAMGIVYAADPSPTGTVSIGFTIPSLVDVLTFLIRIFFVIAGVMALLYLLQGALSWITSGGDKENVKKAQDKIQAAVIGLIVIVAVLALIVTLEQVVFKKQICVGLSCPISIPSLIETTPAP